MRTPEEIIRSLEACSVRVCPVEDCPYQDDDRSLYSEDCVSVLMRDAMQLIRQLTTQNETQADTIGQLISAIGGQPLRPPNREEEQP